MCPAVAADYPEDKQGVRRRIPRNTSRFRDRITRTKTAPEGAAFQTK
jgi:hypothetical protein